MYSYYAMDHHNACIDLMRKR